MNDHFDLRWSYVILTILAGTLAIFSAHTHFINGDDWSSAFMSNIAAGIVGSLIIIFLIDKIIDRNNRNERLRLSRIAFERLKNPLIWHLNLLCDMYRAVTKEKPEHIPSTFEEIFTDSFYEEVTFLDYRKAAPSDIPWNVFLHIKSHHTLDYETHKTGIIWFTYIFRSLEVFIERIDQIIDRYAIFLNVEVVETLENILHSDFIKFVYWHWHTHTGKYMGTPRWMDTKHTLKTHIPIIVNLIKLYNSHMSTPIEVAFGIENFWAARIPWGSARMRKDEESEIKCWKEEMEKWSKEYREWMKYRELKN